MHRASNTFSVLQATAAVVAAATILWSLGFASLRLAEAANVTTFSDTLSTSEPSVAADHTITFSTPSGVANGSSITIDLSSFGATSTITAADITVSTTTGASSVVAATCGGAGDQVGASFGANDSILTLTFCAAETDYVAANGTTTIQIGSTNQLVNPTAGSYTIDLTAGADSGTTRVAIVSTVSVTASVNTIFQFTVTGVATGQTVNGTTTGGSTTATSIPFGVLDANTASTAAQDLTVVTNARNGFTVTVVSDGQLDSATGADIDSFKDGGNQTSPVAWAPPSATIGLENTYGHWGITSDDTDIFSAQQTYVAASTSPVTIFTHDGPVDGVTSPSTGTSTTRVGYTVETSSLQEAATDYTAILTYIATPVF